MFVRIVKMSFKADKIEKFLANFDKKKEDIRNSSGCSLLELYRDQTDPNIFFTYSYWNKEQDLEDYKNSALFKDIWSKTKIMFNDKPLAWSVNKIISLP